MQPLVVVKVIELCTSVLLKLPDVVDFSPNVPGTSTICEPYYYHCFFIYWKFTADGSQWLADALSSTDLHGIANDVFVCRYKEISDKKWRHNTT